MFFNSNLRFQQLEPTVVIPQDDGTLGIDNLKIVMTIVVTFFVDLISAFKTKNWGQIAQILFNLIRFGNILMLAQTAWKELGDLSQPETEEMNIHFAETLDLENDEVEARIEQAFSIIPRAYQLILNGVAVWAGAQSIYQEIRSLFRKGGELEEIAGIVDTSA